MVFETKLNRPWSSILCRLFNLGDDDSRASLAFFKVPRSTATYQEVPQSTKKYPEVPQSTLDDDFQAPLVIQSSIGGCIRMTRRSTLGCTAPDRVQWRRVQLWGFIQKSSSCSVTKVHPLTGDKKRAHLVWTFIEVKVCDPSLIHAPLK